MKMRFGKSRLAAVVGILFIVLNSFSCQCDARGGDKDSDWLSGEISVSDTKKVRFTKGNLYWDGSNFKMESNQYDYRTWYMIDDSDTSGSAKKNAVINGISCSTPFYGDSYSDEIGNSTTGLLYWSKNLAVTYKWKYDYDDDVSENDTFAIAKTTEHDAAIAGNDRYDYDVLSAEEWQYILDRKDDKNKPKHGLATIKLSNNPEDFVNGLVILPDEFTLDFVPGRDNEKKWEANTYTKESWERMEKAGAVFLPAPGRRYYFYAAAEGQTIETYSIDYVNAQGYYQSTNIDIGVTPPSTLCLWVNSSSVAEINGFGRNAGASVRLVAIEK